VALSVNSRVGSYEVVAPIGAGGMGEVYRARDTRLKRDVALKVLPEVLAQDADRLARFRREAELLATLNHPNIAAVYGLEESAPSSSQPVIIAIVLELVEGDTLADLISRGPVPVDDALALARQIADALEAAHDKGVIHRDLKPANIKVTPDRRVKVLDFGLAKMLESPAALDATTMGHAATMSPTLSLHATYAGVIHGTAAYMAPEQAKGKPVDRRGDIWAFGVVLAEMLSGRVLYDGDTAAETLARVIEREPDLSRLPAKTPESIRALLRRCLTKDPRVRLQAIGEARIALDQSHTDAPSLPTVHVRPSPLPWTVAAVATAVAVGVALLWAPWRVSPAPARTLLSAELGIDQSLLTLGGANAVLSPDGRMLVFAAGSPERSQLYVRRLDQLQAVPLAGTEGANSPFFSPDGQWVAFFAEATLKKISVNGGATVTLADTNSVRGGWWDESDQITFAALSVNAPLLRVSASGGPVATLTTLQPGELTHRWPQVLPGGKAVLYTANDIVNNFDAANLIVQQLPSGPRTIVHRGATYGRYLPSGHLVFVREATLFAAPFDLNRLEITGAPVPVIEGVSSANQIGGAQFSVSNDGTLVYLPGTAAQTNVPMHWLTRDGSMTPLRTMTADWSNVVFAADGRRLAMDISNDRKTDVWVYDWIRETLSTLTTSGNEQKPVWTPDGHRIVYSSGRENKGALNLYWQRADGTGTPQRLTNSAFNQGAWSFHPNGNLLLFHEFSPDSRDDIWMLPIDGDEAAGWKLGTPTVFRKTPAAERAPMFSPDGKWIAYQATDSGRDEVYVESFPPGNGRWPISAGAEGGVLPTWSRTRRELFYATLDSHIMVVPYSVEGNTFRPEKPRLWADIRFTPRVRTGPNRSFDLHPDGDRFAVAPVMATADTVKRDKVVFVFNFFDELRRIATAKK
jgi:serine/threonine protein kinase/Tol biopolymer transport system component